MKPGAAILFLSTLLQLLPKRRCLLIIAGWNSNCDTREFYEQLSFIGDFAVIHVTPTTIWRAAVLHFLRKMGVRDPKVERSSIPVKWLGYASLDNIVVKWLGGEFQIAENSNADHEDCVRALMSLFDAYVIYLNGGSPPDDECCWDLPFPSV